MLIIHERTGDWAVTLRTALKQLHHRMELVETRSVRECLTVLSAHPRACVAVELTVAGGGAAWELLARVGLQFPQACSLVLADRGLAEWELSARELGAVHYVDSPRRVAAVLEIAQRQLLYASRQPAWITDEPAANQAGRYANWWRQAALPWGADDDDLGPDMKIDNE